MTHRGVFVWRVRLSLLLLVFGSLLVEREEAAHEPPAPNQITGPAAPADVLTVHAAVVERADSDWPRARKDSGPRHLGDARIATSISAGGPR